jgi:desulfoferrodoxin (superoxide reductase-like protein)
MGFYPVAVYYNKTQHTKTHITQITHHTRTNTAHKTTQTIKDTLHTMNATHYTQWITSYLQYYSYKRGTKSFFWKTSITFPV